MSGGPRVSTIGTCTPAAVRPAVAAEKAGIPSVVVTLTGFTRVAQQAAKALGVPDLSIAEYPGAVGVHEYELVRRNVKDVLFERIVDGLTRVQRAGSGAADKAAAKQDQMILLCPAVCSGSCRPQR